MNLLLLEQPELDEAGWAVVAGRRAAHMRSVLRVEPGSRVRVGVVDGRLGTATVRHCSEQAIELQVALHRDPPAPSPCILAVALPRPPVLRRVLQQATTLGVKHIHLFHAARVEKSYWQTPSLQDDVVREQLRLGLEQAADTRLPQVRLHRRFSAFVREQLPAVLAGRTGLWAEPAAQAPCPCDPAGPLMALVGPEGGFLPDERGRLQQLPLRPVSLGPRILRTETAVVALLSRLGGS